MERPPASIIQGRIAAADAVVVLLGPTLQPSSQGGAPERDRWVNEECIYALTLKKPLAIIRHLKTRLPEMTEGLQTPATFDFWEADSFRQSVHNIEQYC